MWIPADHGTARLWVKDEQCYLTNGELAFANERIPTPLPQWFGAPTASTIRHLYDHRDEALERFETRSMQASAADVVAFYWDRIAAGGLAPIADPVTPELPGRCCPGFSAGSAEHRISINVYPWRDLAFWSTSLSHPDRKRKEISVPLRVVRRTAERVTLWIPHRMEECWAPTSAVTDVDPFDLEEYLGHLQQRREHKLMQWSMLPGWLQFAIPGRTQSLFGRGSDPSEWEARTVLTSSNDPYAVFNACLELLDSHGFDSTGGIRPGHSYFLQVWQQGQILQSCIHSDSEGEAIVALLNAGEVSISLRYSKSGCILAA